MRAPGDPLNRIAVARCGFPPVLSCQFSRGPNGVLISPNLNRTDSGWPSTFDADYMKRLLERLADGILESSCRLGPRS